MKPVYGSAWEELAATVKLADHTWMKIGYIGRIVDGKLECIGN